jgi:hypothetical protein
MNGSIGLEFGLVLASLALAALAPPLLAARIYLRERKRRGPTGTPRHGLAYGVAFAAWFSVLALAAWLFLGLEGTPAPPEPPSQGTPSPTPAPAGSAMLPPPPTTLPPPATAMPPPPPTTMPRPSPTATPRATPFPPPATPAPTLPAFPWPPPAASAETLIPDSWLRTRGRADLAGVATALESALRAAKYREWSYSSVPGGFALVCQMEQIEADGAPSPGPVRWSTQLPRVANMDLLEFVRALVGAAPGYYRVIVFIVTNQPWSRVGERPAGRAAQEWLAKGLVWLPDSVGRLPYGLDYRTTALVYEFQKVSKDADATLLKPSPASADDHLEKAGISDWLSRP